MWTSASDAVYLRVVISAATGFLEDPFGPSNAATSARSVALAPATGRFSSLRVCQGLSQKAIAALLGHADTDATERYTHLQVRAMAPFVEERRERLTGATPR